MWPIIQLSVDLKSERKSWMTAKKGKFIPESHHANHSLGNHQLWKWNRVIINTVRQMANLLQFCWIENWVMYFCICIFVYLYLCHDQYSLEDGQFVASVLDRKLGHVHWPESEKLSRFRLNKTGRSLEILFNLTTTTKYPNNQIGDYIRFLGDTLQLGIWEPYYKFQLIFSTIF